MSSTQQLLLGEGAGGSAPVYIEDVFSTYLYTGNGSTQTITNNIDLSTKGGLVWIKSRPAFVDFAMYDTARGATQEIGSNSVSVQTTQANGLTAFNTTGFNLGSSTLVNASGNTFVSWTFREQAKFFDVVTWTGNDTNRTIAHALGSVPGCIMVKRVDTLSANWAVYHRSLANTQYLVLNDTAAAATGAAWWNSTTPTSTVFSLGTNGDVNASGSTYVAYLFAHDAGGFGAAGTDNVISCGTFTTDASGNATVNLGYEPQWTLQKRTNSTGNWFISDVMRGMTVSAAANLLRPNLSDAESTGGTITPTATGFTVSGYGNGLSIIYIAIRRGPMAVPTSATTVFTPLALNNVSGTVNTTGFPIDLQMQFYRSGGIGASNSQWVDRLRGFSSTSTQIGPRLYTPSDIAENDTALGTLFSNTGFSTSGNWASIPMVYWNWRRAPGFFDEVCYDGNSTSGRTVTHNLGVAPELIIVKSRNTGTNWAVYCQPLGNTKRLILNLDVADNADVTYWNNTSPTSTVFYVGNSPNVNTTSQTYVAYLFATCAGVSKVGSYTGTGTTLQINCGFTAGSRFVMIKRSDSTGDWYVWDSARGIVSGNDPYLLFNSTAAEVTNTDYVDTYSAGFEISSTAPAAINANGGTFIFLAIA